MILIDYYFTPLRMMISKREPVRLTIELTNKSKDEEVVSMEVMLPKEFSFGKGTFKRNITERIPKFSSFDKKKFEYEVSAHPLYITAGEKKIQIRAVKHHNSFSYAEKEYDKDAVLIVNE